MKKLKLFFACLLMAVLSIGQMWGAVGDTYTQITGKLSEGTHEVLIAVGDYNTSNSATSGSSYIASDKTTGTYISLSAVTFGGSAGAYTYVCTDAKQIYTIVVDANGDITSAKSSDNTYFSPSTSSNKLLTDEAGMDVEVSGNCYKWSKTSGSNTYYVCSQYSYNLRAYKGKCGNAKYCCDLILLEKASTPSCTKTVSVAKTTPVNGGFEISATEVCGDGDGGEVTISNIEPATGYTLDEVSVTVGTYSALTGKVTGITDDTEITVTFKALPKYTVSFNVGGSTASQADITEASAGAGITLPTGPTPTCSADGWTFAGWAAAAVSSQTTEAPTLLSGTYHPTENVTLYAVYKKTEGGASGAAVGTTMWSENFTGAGNKTTPTSPTAAGSVVYGSATVTYTWTDGGTTSQVYLDTSGPHTDANNDNALISKGDGNLTISGIPTGSASTLTLSYAIAGQGSIAPSTSTANVSIDENTITIEDSEVTTFDLIFTNSHSSKNGRLDDIVVTVATTSSAGTTYYLSAPTCAAPTCTNLDAPTVSVPEEDLTHNSAKLTWVADANAAKYIVKFAGVDHETTNAYYEATGLTENTDYTYQVKAVAADGQSDWCDSEFSAEVSLKTKTAPEVQLWLVKKQGESAVNGGTHTLGVEFDIPASDVECSKTFVGWTTEAYKDYTHATDAPATLINKYTFEDETPVTLYAVYADVVPGDPTLTKLGSAATFANGDKLVIVAKGTSYGIYFENAGGSYVKNWSIAGEDPVLTELTDSKKILTLESSSTNWKFGDATNGYFYSSSSNNLEISTTNSTAFTINWNGTESAFTIQKSEDDRYLNCRTDLTNSNANLWRFNGTNTNSGSPFLHIYRYALGESTRTNYATTCSDPLEKPVFSLDPNDGPFATAQTIELTATEGDIYYTLDETNPENSVTRIAYDSEAKIVLNTCGSFTIKAIAISSTSKSAVETKTYEMAIPIPSVSAEDPYTEAEAIAVYDEGCYNNEDVWVTGTVQTAQFYSSKTYTITLTNGFQFYKFYDLDGAEFTDDYIEAGDVLVAKGKLSKHSTTYQLAEGCYLVSRTPAPTKEHIANEVDNPYTIAQAINFINNAATYDLSEEVYVQGTVKTDATLSSYGNYDVIVTDGGVSDPEFKFYRMQKSATEMFDVDEEIGALDVLVVKGTLLKYNSVYELAEGCYMISHTKYVAPIIAVESVELDETAITLKEGKFMTLTATVLPAEASNKNVTWETSDEDIATVDENGKVTAVAIGNATITVKSAYDPTITATCGVTVIDASSRSLPNAVFQKVTATITSGKYLIVYEGDATHPAVAFDGALETLDDVGNTIDVTIDGDLIVAPGDAAFTIDIVAGTIKSYSGYYIGQTANSNGLKQTDDDSSPYTNTFAITDGAAVITSSGNPTLRYNYASDQLRFRYYKSGQQAIQLYKMLDEDVVRANLSEGKWGTICPAQKVMAPTGASFYTIAYVEKHGNEPYKVFFDEIAEGESLAAGQPYIFIAEGEAIKGVKVGDAATEGINDHGFIGKVEQYDFQVSAEDVTAYKYYMVKDNNIRLCGEGWFRVAAERAYIDMTAGINTVAHAPAVGRRRVCLTNDAPQSPQGFENIESGDAPMKVMIEGTLYILRGEKVYDATGRLVK